MDTASLTDLYILPHLDSHPNDSWTIDGADMIPALDPSLRTQCTGTLTAVRKDDTTVNGQPAARITLSDGVLDMQASDSTSEAVGRWAPRGELLYSFAD